MLVVCLSRQTFVLEQPGSSVLMLTSRMSWLCDSMLHIGMPIYKQAFWLGCYGHRSPKRTCLWSNNPFIRVFQTQKLLRDTLDGTLNVKHYESLSGKQGYTATKSLKGTELLGAYKT